MRALSGLLSMCVVCGVASIAAAGTLDDIVSNVAANANAVTDISAEVDINTVNGPGDWSNFADAVYKAKGAKFLLEGAGADVRKMRTDGTTFWVQNCGGVEGNWEYGNYSDFIADSQDNFVAMSDHAAVISGNTWSLDGSTSTVNGVSVHRIYCTDYEMFVDTATKTKVIKIVKLTGNAESVTYSGYSLVASTAHVPSTIVHAITNNGTTITTTMTMSSISINQNLADSTFTVGN